VPTSSSSGWTPQGSTLTLHDCVPAFRFFRRFALPNCGAAFWARASSPTGQGSIKSINQSQQPRSKWGLRGLGAVGLCSPCLCGGGGVCTGGGVTWGLCLPCPGVGRWLSGIIIWSSWYWWRVRPPREGWGVCCLLVASPPPPEMCVCVWVGSGAVYIPWWRVRAPSG